MGKVAARLDPEYLIRLYKAKITEIKPYFLYKFVKPSQNRKVSFQ